MLSAHHLTFGYPKQEPLITDLSLEIPAHKITCLVGPNGSGKSTLFKLLTRQVKPQAGTVRLDGQGLWQLKPTAVAQQIALVHQQHQLADTMTVADLVALGRLPYQSSLLASPAAADSAAVLERFGLTALADQPVTTLSGGQAQRVWLALALNQRPTYLFLDEPTTYLDLRYQAELLRLLRRLNQEEGLTIVMILHDLNQALRYCNHCFLLTGGKLVASGAPAAVLTPSQVAASFRLRCDLVETPRGPILVTE